MVEHGNVEKIDSQSGEGHDHGASDKHDGDHHEHYDGYIPIMPFFRMIRQRNRWGEKQELPHGDFTATFFDLFYVAAAYNLGSLIKADPSSTGLLYFIGCFLPLQMLWFYKTYFDARYYFITSDIFHETMDKAGLLSLSTAILHIRPVAVLSNPQDNIDMFLFSLGLTICFSFKCARLIEIMISEKICEKNNNNGEKVPLYPEAFGASRRDLSLIVVPFIFSLAAAIYSGLEYYGNTSTISNLDSNEGYYNKTYSNETSDANHHRHLADSSSGSNPNYTTGNIPIWLLLGGVLGNQVMQCYFYLIRIPNNPNRKDFAVPLNVSFCIHRYGEWVMLMMGESVLSLLIVGVKEAWQYFGTFFCGILSIIFLQYLHFRSQPHDPDEHAMRKSVRAANCFTILMQIYATALVTLGASYKMFLYEYVYASNSHRRQLYYSDMNYDSHRWLAGSCDPDRQQRIANIFSGSMAIVFFCLEGLTYVHEGFHHDGRACQKSMGMKLIGITLLSLRFAVIVFVASVSQYITSPSDLAGIGLGCIFLQIILRVIASFFFFPDDAEEEKDEIEAAKALMNHVQPDVSESHHN